MAPGAERAGVSTFAASAIRQETMRIEAGQLN